MDTKKIKIAPLDEIEGKKGIKVLSTLILDTHLVLYPLEIRKCNGETINVFQMKCGSFGCEDYYLGEYMPQGLCFYKESQRSSSSM